MPGPRARVGIPLNRFKPPSNVITNRSKAVLLVCLRPKCRAPLGHTLLYCQGALMPSLTKHAINSCFVFFAIFRRYHLKWLSSYVNNISGYVLALTEPMSCLLFPDSYAFFIAKCFLVNLTGVHKLDSRGSTRL